MGTENIKINDMNSQDAEKAIRQRIERLNYHSGTKKELSSSLKNKLEIHFGYSMNNLEIRESNDVNAIDAKAYASGNVVHFKPGMFNQDTVEGKKMIGHEIAHVLQQSKGIGNIGGMNLDHNLETSADRHGDAIAGMNDVGETPRSLNAIPTAQSEFAPVQGWGVGGIAAWLLNSVLGRHKKKNGVDSDANYVGVHELLTAKAAKKAGAALRNEGNDDAAKELEDKQAQESLRAGARWNDVSYNGNVLFALKYKLQNSAFLNQSHHGDLQFLHSMDTTNGNTEENARKIRRWGQFANDTFRNDSIGEEGNFQDQNIFDYTMSQKDDIFMEMLGSTMVSRSILKEIEKSAEKAGAKGTDKYKKRRQQLIRVHLLEMQALKTKQKNERLTFGERRALRKGLSKQAGKSIRDFFTNGNRNMDAGYMALGSAAHMLEDSFAGSHALREYNIMDVGGVDGLQIGANQSQAIADRTTPIMLNADYTRQDETRHAFADQLLLGNLSDEDRDRGKDQFDADIVNTAGAGLSRDVAAQFMYNAITRSNDMNDYLKNVTKVSDTNNLSITGSGRQYGEDEKTYVDSEGNTKKYSRQTSRAIEKYGETQHSKIGYNYVMSVDNRIEANTEILNAFCELMDKVKESERPFVFKEYQKHLNEIEIETRGMLRQVSTGFFVGDENDVTEKLNAMLQIIQAVRNNI